MTDTCAFSAYGEGRLPDLRTEADLPFPIQSNDSEPLADQASQRRTTPDRAVLAAYSPFAYEFGLPWSVRSGGGQTQYDRGYGFALRLATRTIYPVFKEQRY